MKKTVVFLMGEWFLLTLEKEDEVKVEHLKTRPNDVENVHFDKLTKTVQRKIWLELREFCRANGKDQNAVEKYFAFLNTGERFTISNWFTNLLKGFQNRFLSQTKSG